ncbi:response regulator [Aureimonas pseudogalii]|uniref:histidine kinase n=1 Tax=Aureimonas pseudogalii TaxID=1744844 RepID=A0A7W6EF89_9HYPH|nr:response regulator [Aureimonas pseudogalii]MBB3996779.1 PAS domain S-box-containing protein [Aureimonas pseudogalii]
MTKNGAGSASGNMGAATPDAGLGRTAILAGLLLMVAIAAFGWTLWQSTQRETVTAANTSVIAESERLLSIMASLESSTRGYVLVGTPEFLDPFRHSQAGLDAQFARMSDPWKGAGADPDRLVRLRSLVAQESAFESEVVRLRETVGFEPAAALVRTGQGKAIMDRIRAEIATAQRNAVDRVSVGAAAAARNEVISNIAFLAAILSAAALAVLAFRRHLEGRRASDLLSSVLDNSPVAIGFADRDGRIRRLNSSFAAAGTALGRPVAIGDRLLDLFPREAERLQGMFAETLNGGAEHDNVELRVGEDGDEAIYLASLYPLRTEGRITAETVGVGVVLVNATQRILAEEQLVNSESRFRSLIEATSAIVWSVPSSSRFSGEQPGWSSFTGQSEAEYSDFGWVDAVHPDDREKSAIAWRAATEARTPYTIEHRLRRADGEWRDMQARAAPIFEETGEIREWIGTHTDITEQKRTAAALGETNLQFRAIADNIPQFAWIAETSGAIGWYNQRWFDYTGKSFAEMKGLGWQTVHHPDHIERVMLGLNRSFSAGEPWEDTFPLRSADGSYRWFLSQAVPIRDETGAIVRWFGTNTDVTTQRAAEQELAAAKEAAENANRAKSQFIANMSHELRTPLSAVIGYAEMLEEEVEDLGEKHLLGDLKKIEQNARHLLSLINDVLDLSKIEAERMDVYAETFDLGTVMEEVASTVGSLVAKKDNRLVVEHAGDLGSVHTDQVKLRQCLINLLSNASKFTENGTIRLTAKRVTDDGRDWITFEVADTGIGMTGEQVGRLFERFAQADSSTTRKFGGTGLGLAITRAFCRLLGGDIGVRSEEGEGTTFTIRIPAAITDAPPAEDETEANQPVAPAEREASSGLVLAIDDDPHARELVVRFLTKEGFAVRTAADGLSGLQMARMLHPDVILLDVTMPKMDGWTVLTELKADPELASIPVVMITILDEHSLGYALGASDYLIKPVEWSRLKSVMTRYRTPGNSLVLAVDDDADALQRTATMLERETLNVVTAANGQEALERVALERPGLILLDLVMPVMDGFGFLHALRSREDWRDIPVIVLTSKDLTTEEFNQLQGQTERILTKGDIDLRDLAAQIRVMVQTPDEQQADRHERQVEPETMP